MFLILPCLCRLGVTLATIIHIEIFNLLKVLSVRMDAFMKCPGSFSKLTSDFVVFFDLYMQSCVYLRKFWDRLYEVT